MYSSENIRLLLVAIIYFTIYSSEQVTNNHIRDQDISGSFAKRMTLSYVDHVPFVVQLFTDTNTFKCAGLLINSHKVITTKTCTGKLTSTQVTKLRYHDDDYWVPITTKMIDKYSNAKNDDSLYYFDGGVIKLPHALKNYPDEIPNWKSSLSSVNKIIQHGKNGANMGYFGVTGWGGQYSEHFSPRYMLRVEILNTTSPCQMRFGLTSPIPKTMFCFLIITPDGHLDEKDEGDPIFFYDGTQDKVLPIGLTHIPVSQKPSSSSDLEYHLAVLFTKF